MNIILNIINKIKTNLVYILGGVFIFFSILTYFFLNKKMMMILILIGVVLLIALISKFKKE